MDEVDDYSELIEDLRERAALSAEEMNEGYGILAKVIPARTFTEDDTVEGDAAFVIERLVAALIKILNGATDPAGVARDALDPTAMLQRELSR